MTGSSAEALMEEKGLSVAEMDAMREVEDELWWFRALRKQVLDALAPTRPDFKLLDAGCGSGGMLARLRERFPHAQLTALDVSERALEWTGQRGVNAQLVQGYVDRLPFADEEFDVVLSIDVIVMRGVDPEAAVREMYRVLRPGGTFVINVAAFDFLRGSHDVAVNMARRYTRAELAQLLRTTGFTIERMTYWNTTLFPAAAAFRWLSRRRAQQANLRSDVQPLWPPLNAVLTRVASTEVALARHISLPFGTSLFTVARK